MQPLISRIESTLARLHSEARAGLIVYLCAGDPDFETSLALLDAAGEADMVEIGLPFSDPVADGPILQGAHMRALAGGQTVAKTLQLLGDWRRRRSDTPAILMGYLNPILAYGVERFMRDAAGAGADALILVDLPHEHGHAVRQLAQAAGLSIIQMVAQTSDQVRRAKILDQAEGFVYQVMLNGTTGAQLVQPELQMGVLGELRACTTLPIAAGFGIRTQEQARTFAQAADLVVVGSALVQAIQDGPSEGAVTRCRETVRAFLNALRSGAGDDRPLADALDAIQTRD